MSKRKLLQSALSGVRGFWRPRSSRGSESDPSGADPEGKGQSLFRRGRTKMRTGAPEEAIGEFDHALELLPNYAEAVSARAESLDMLGKSDIARPEYARARQLWATQRPGAPDRSYLFRQRGRFTFEVDSYELALLRVKTGSFPHLACGNALLAQGHPEEALKCYDRALKIKQNDADLTALKGEALSMMGRYRQAIEAFNFALAANPKAAETLNARAIALAASGKLEEANADWRRQLVLLPPADAAARACIALRLGDYEAALPELDRVIAKAPADPYWTLYRLSALRRLDRPVGGIVPPSDDAWPAPLFALHAGSMPFDEVLERADNAGRLAEATFQLGAVIRASDRTAAGRYWKETIEHGTPALIEYAAARNELSRLKQ